MFGSKYDKYFFGLLVFIVITSVLGWWLKNQEMEMVDLETFSDFKQMSDINVYDKFYSNVYNNLFSSEMKNEFEIYNIKQYGLDEDIHWKKNNHLIKILDIGCGTGAHLKILRRYGYEVAGLDRSEGMVKKAKQANPGIEIKTGDFLDKGMFENREFSHILCLFYSIYYTDEVDTLFKNVNYWLMPKGYFAVHLVNRNKFDPVLEKSTSLIPFYNPQKHTDKRNTKTKLVFKEFNYTADWDFSGKNKVKFIENFIGKQGQALRKNIHNLNMETLKYYVKVATNNGFEVAKIIDLAPVGHTYNYIYLFRKKYGE
jgi:SAM-dependent methyltransferase